jgi:hypothetical protein
LSIGVGIAYLNLFNFRRNTMSQAQEFSLALPSNNLMAIEAIKKAGGTVDYRNKFLCMSPDYGKVIFPDESTFTLQFHDGYHYSGNCY